VGTASPSSSGASSPGLSEGVFTSVRRLRIRSVRSSKEASSAASFVFAVSSSFSPLRVEASSAALVFAATAAPLDASSAAFVFVATAAPLRVATILRPSLCLELNHERSETVVGTMARVQPGGEWWQEGEDRQEPLEVHLDRADRAQEGAAFAAPVRGGVGGDADGVTRGDTLEQLDGLLNEVAKGFDGWDGDGAFSSGRSARRRRSNRVQPAAAFSGDHADPAVDVDAVFGGTEAQEAAAAAAAAREQGPRLTVELEEQVRRLKEALEATRRKLDRCRDDLDEAEDELEAYSETLPIHVQYTS